ncbi:hypothetical protein Scep_007105 [Stephania cephalantha]|uniref:Uncharacterized protein n=1 Tax=Stephania cephalantha TaxID=152367 RepID=A0AAP0K945_9MAGN
MAERGDQRTDEIRRVQAAARRRRTDNEHDSGSGGAMRAWRVSERGRAGAWRWCCCKAPAPATRGGQHDARAWISGSRSGGGNGALAQRRDRRESAAARHVCGVRDDTLRIGAVRADGSVPAAEAVCGAAQGCGSRTSDRPRMKRRRRGSKACDDAGDRRVARAPAKSARSSGCDAL